MDYLRREVKAFPTKPMYITEYGNRGVHTIHGDTFYSEDLQADYIQTVEGDPQLRRAFGRGAVVLGRLLPPPHLHSVRGIRSVRCGDGRPAAEGGAAKAGGDVRRETGRTAGNRSINVGVDHGRGMTVPSGWIRSTPLMPE